MVNTLEVREIGVTVGRVVQFNKISDTLSDCKNIDSMFVFLFINEESFE